jgi:DNA-binding NarL/FixJ family response regulator
MSGGATNHTPQAVCALAQFCVGDSVCIVVPADAAHQHAAVGLLTLGSTSYSICLRPSDVAAQHTDDIVSLLTSRELEIAMLISAGHSNKQIARRLGISRYTVGTHVARLFAKLAVHNRSALVTRVLSRLRAGVDE